MKRAALSWWAVILPAFAVGGFEFLRHSLLERFLPAPAGNLVAALLVGCGAAVYVSVAARYIRQAERSLSAAREEAAVLQERDRIARAMHDNVSQAIFYLGVRLNDLQRQIERGERDSAAALVAEVRENLNETNGRVRTAIADLRRRPAPRLVGPTVAELVRQTAAEAGLSVRVEGADLSVPLDESRLEQVLGVVQEALNNTAKHAGVHQAAVEVRQVGRNLAVTVVDQGRGFRPDQVTGGFGLMMMQERAELARGRLTLETAPGAGVRVSLTVPLEVT